ncbi:MAG TPA: diacylglycerol kinase [bacterium]|nr:diacylglycerol kinase [bacterium]
MSSRSSRPRSFLTSVACAVRGLTGAARTQPHMRAHLGFAAAALATGAWAGLTGVELAVIALAVGLVLAAELANTAIESLTDAVHPDPGPVAAAVKDAAAAAVLIAAAVALCAGAFVLGSRVGVPAAAVDRGLPLLAAAACLVALAAGAARARR